MRINRPAMISNTVAMKTPLRGLKSVRRARCIPAHGPILTRAASSDVPTSSISAAGRGTVWTGAANPSRPWALVTTTMGGGDDECRFGDQSPPAPGDEGARWSYTALASTPAIGGPHRTGGRDRR